MSAGSGARPAAWDELVADVSSARNPYAVCVRLLMYCSRQAPLIHDAWASGQVALEKQARRDLGVTAQVESPSAVQWGEWASRHLEALRDRSRLADGLVARVVVWVVSEVAHSYIVDYFGAQGAQTIESLPAIPHSVIDFRSLTDGLALGPQTERQLSRSPSATPWLRLVAPIAGRLNVVIDPTSRASIDEALGDGSRMPNIVTCHPVPEPGDLAGEPPFEYPGSMVLEEVDVDSSRFFGARPAQSSLDAIEQLLAIAVANHADVVVLPEMCTTDVAAVGSSLAARSIPLLVTGSAHRHEAGERVNESMLASHGVGLAVHRKIIPFDWAPRPAGDPPGPELTEWLDPSQSEVRLVLGSTWSVVQLICSDLNSNEVHEAVRTLGPTLLLVPAWTQKAGYFPGRFSSYATEHQTISVLANGPRSDGMPHAYFGFSYGDGDMVVRHLEGGDVPFAAQLNIVHRRMDRLG